MTRAKYKCPKCDAEFDELLERKNEHPFGTNWHYITSICPACGHEEGAHIPFLYYESEEDKEKRKKKAKLWQKGLEELDKKIKKELDKSKED
jgi:DNA-directed RNA polymerase subunit M/transcription elongation factor TFIIS